MAAVCYPAIARDSPNGDGKPYAVIDCTHCNGTCREIHGNALEPIIGAVTAPFKPITDSTDFLNRLWKVLSNPTYYKLAGLITLGMLAVTIGGYIFLKEAT